GTSSARRGHGDRIEVGARTGRLPPLSARRQGEQHDRRERDPRYATHCHRAHWETATPRRIPLTARIAVCARGRPPTTASARKIGNRASPKRGIESSGHLLLGTLSGIARPAKQETP